MVKQKSIEETGKAMEEKVYANPILYLHKSRVGKHLFAFNIEKKGGEEGDMVLGNDIESLILNISDVSAVIEGQMKWAKVSVVRVKEEG